MEEELISEDLYQLILSHGFQGDRPTYGQAIPYIKTQYKLEISLKPVENSQNYKGFVYSMKQQRSKLVQDMKIAEIGEGSLEQTMKLTTLAAIDEIIRRL